MRGIEKVALSATAALKGLEKVGDDLSGKDRQMARTRDDFESRVAAEVALAEDLIESTQTRVDQLRDRIRRIKYWGSA